MKKIIVFTGAGLGVPLGLPTTTEFEKTIDRYINNELSKAMRYFLKGKYNDIEHVLSALEFFTKNDSSLLKAILASPPYPGGSAEHSWLLQA